MAKRSFRLLDENNMTVSENGKSALPVICERIRFYREKIGIDQKEMAARIGITGNSVSNWETGRSRPDVNLLPSVCKVLNITLYELFNLHDPSGKITPAQQDLLRRYQALSAGHQYAVDALIDTLTVVEQTEYRPELKKLLRFRRSLAAGTGDPTEFEDDAEAVYIYDSPETARADSIFKVNGDSMEPEFSDGQEVLVQRNSRLNPGEIGAFIVGNETYIKKYETDGLHSLNPDYPVMRFDDETSVYLIGKVIGILSPENYASPQDIEQYKLIHREK